MTDTNGTAVAVYEAPPAHAMSVFGTDDTDEIMVRAARVSHAVQALVTSQGFASKIGGRDHVNVEGWNGLGSILGLGVRVEFVRPFTDSRGEGGYEAAVSIVTRDGAVVGGAHAICTRSEKTWRTRDDYALYSMAQTRATGKAYRSSLSWLMKMAGFEATPAEEMPEPAPPPLPPRTVDDAAADLGLPVDELVAWWTRDGAAWDAKAEHAVARMTPGQLHKAARSIDEWRAAAAPAEVTPDEEHGDTDTKGSAPRGRKAKRDDAPAEPVELDPDDLIPPGGPTPVVPAEDDIPF